jgi:hypothetical protein
VTARTVWRLRLRYRTQGLLGLLDRRSIRPARPLGRVDPRVVAAAHAAIARETPRSTGTKARLWRVVQAALTAEHGEGEVPLPSQRTFERLVDALAAGQHTFGPATSRRTRANRPPGPFTPTAASRPGEMVQIDTTPLDVMAVLDDGVVGRVELTIALDVATRTIAAAVLRPRHQGRRRVPAARADPSAGADATRRPGQLQCHRTCRDLPRRADHLVSLQARAVRLRPRLPGAGAVRIAAARRGDELRLLRG